jgi:hypothetical protein
MFIAFLSTCAVYLLPIWLFNYYLDIYFIFKANIFWKIPIISILAWAPFYIASSIKRKIFPQITEKLNQS